MAQIRKPQEASHSDGTVAIEYGLILPAMLLFTLGIMDTGRLLWTYITLSRAAEAAARCGAVNTTTYPAASIPAYAVTQAWGINDVTAADFTSQSDSSLRCASCSNLYLHIYHPVVPVVQRVGAIWRPYHDAECDGVLSEAIVVMSASHLRSGSGKHTSVPAAGLGGVERPVGRRNDGLRELGDT